MRARSLFMSGADCWPQRGMEASRLSASSVPTLVVERPRIATRIPGGSNRGGNAAARSHEAVGVCARQDTCTNVRVELGGIEPRRIGAAKVLITALLKPVLTSAGVTA